MLRRLRESAAPALLVLCAGLAYWDTFRVPLLLDDLIVVTGNPSIRQLWPIGAALSPSDHVGTGGRPLSNLSFAVNYAVSGEAVWSYHALNLVLHALAGLALFGVLRRTLLHPPGRPGADAAPFPPGAATGLALAISALWLVHPIQTASVTYLSQRTELLMALCYLAALYTFIRAVESGNWIWKLLCCGATFAGMACKESMATAPLVILLYDRTFLAGSFARALRLRAGLYGALASSWVLLASLLSTNLHERHLGFNLGVSPWSYALTESQAIVTYLKLALWPHPLIFDYGAIFIQRFTAALPYLLIVVTLLGITLWLFQRRHALGFPALAFFVILGPTSSVVPIALQPIAENRMYLPLAAVVTVVILGLNAVTRWRRPLLFAVIGAAFIATTMARNSVYQSSLELWRDTMQKRPQNARAFDNYAQELVATGRADHALPYLQRALALNPQSPATHAMLGDVLLNLGRTGEAENSYRIALSLDERMTAARNNLGAILSHAGRHAEAVTELRRAISQSETADAHHNLGLALAKLGERDAATRHFQRSLTLAPANAQFHFNYALHLGAQQRARESIEHLRTAIRLNPRFAAAHAALALAFIQQEDFASALRHSEMVLSLEPGHAEAHNNAGVALARLGRLDEAIAQFAEAVRLKPDYDEARKNLANVRQATGR